MGRKSTHVKTISNLLIDFSFAKILLFHAIVLVRCFFVLLFQTMMDDWGGGVVRTKIDKNKNIISS